MGLILLSIDSSTLSLVAVLVVIRDLTSALLGSAVGAYVDRCACCMAHTHKCMPSTQAAALDPLPACSTPRLRAASLLYFVQAMSIASAALCLLLVFVFKVGARLTTD